MRKDKTINSNIKIKMAQKIKNLAFPYGMQKKMSEETGISKNSIYFACSCRSLSKRALEIRDLAIAKYGAYPIPTKL